MMEVSKEDSLFIKKILEDELDYSLLVLLDKKLKDPIFRAAYEHALDKKYQNKQGKLRGYLPMIILMGLIGVGIFLIFIK